MEFSNDKYVWSHGKNPRGYGCWAFGTRSEDWVYFVPGSMNLTEAKKEAAKKAKADGIKSTIYVMP